jgi:hypothetical protein
VEGGFMRSLTWRILLVALVLSTTIACGDTIVNLPNDPSAVSNKTPVVVKHTVQFRVIGNASSVRIRYSTPIDGLGQEITSLPNFTTRTVSGESLFLSLEATPIGYAYGVLYPFLAVQIVVDDTVFREATTQDFLLAPLAVSGQWRQ